jgi:tetratricopeptide (TPR) repeat protein
MKKIFKFLIILILVIVWVCLGWPKLAVLFYNKGCDYYDRGLYKEAVVSFEESLKINPSSAIAYYMLANAYIQRNMQDKAIEAYKKTIQIDHNYVQAYSALSQIYRINQRYEEALNQLKEAEGAGLSNQEIKKLWGEISFEYMADCLDRGTDAFLAGDRQKAYALLNKALEIKSDFAYTHYTLAYFYFTEQNYSEAERHLNEALKINPQFWSAYKLLGDIYFQKGAYERAIAQYKEALLLNYNNAGLNNDLGLALVQLERYSDAISSLKEALRLDPGNLNIRYSLASTYRDKGMLAEAIAEYKKIVELRQDYPNLYNDLGDIYKQQGRNKEALDAYHREIEYDQRRLLDNANNTITLNNLAYALNGIGEYDKAKETIGKALILEPNYRQAYLTLAKINEGSGNFNKAIATLEKAKRLSTQTHFIDSDIQRIKSDLRLPTTETLLALDTVYLKNGRQIKGRIKEEDKEKVILEVSLGNTTGSLTFYRNMIELIVKSDAEHKQ